MTAKGSAGDSHFSKVPHCDDADLHHARNFSAAAVAHAHAQLETLFIKFE